MKIEGLIAKCRSYRRFYGDYEVGRDTLYRLINLGRLSASAANLQPFKYMVSCSPGRNNLIFPALRWAGYLTDWEGPWKEERPSAYIIMLGDKGISSDFGCGCGIASQSILLGAVEMGLGGCIVASLDREYLRKRLSIPPQFEILHVIALGRPKEKVVIEECRNGNIKYYRTADGIHHVPKRSMDDIIVKGG